MRLRDLVVYCVVGIVIVVFLLIGFFFLEFYLPNLMNYSFPIGYAVLIVCIVLLLPIGVGVINALAKYYVYREGREEISLNFWYYGVFLTLIFLSFRTLFGYVGTYASLLLMLTLGSAVIGMTSRYT